MADEFNLPSRDPAEPPAILGPLHSWKPCPLRRLGDPAVPGAEEGERRKAGEEAGAKDTTGGGREERREEGGEEDEEKDTREEDVVETESEVSMVGSLVVAVQKETFRRSGEGPPPATEEEEELPQVSERVKMEARNAAVRAVASFASTASTALFVRVPEADAESSRNRGIQLGAASREEAFNSASALFATVLDPSSIAPERNAVASSSQFPFGGGGRGAAGWATCILRESTGRAVSSLSERANTVETDW
ncbi:hypothetical protein T484DRAFT_1910651 [Baffinella frigidus]|nr:hypothetical protein T484DRAFT_1910651 [Cryptophyta sp. CCMP2293]